MPRNFLVDTDVFIDFLRGRGPAKEFVQAAPRPVAVSVITVAELYAGIREGDERRLLEQTLNACEFVGIDAGTAIMAGLYKRDYEKSHSVGLADAVIAATAQTHGYSLATLNRKHYPMLKDVVVPYRKA